jgi:hypothetical protein
MKLVVTSINEHPNLLTLPLNSNGELYCRYTRLVPPAGLVDGGSPPDSLQAGVEPRSLLADVGMHRHKSIFFFVERSCRVTVKY